MKQDALDQARDALARARQAFQDLGPAGGDVRKMKARWSDFLLAAGRVFTKLEQGSKTSPASAGWFSHKKGERRSDPLLAYVHQARNTDEHGLGEVVYAAEGDPPEIHPETPVGTWSRQIQGNATRLSHAETGLSIVARNFDFGLIPVRDQRSGKLFSPPNEHSGQPIPDPTVWVVGRAALDYLQRMVDEAGSLAATP